ncbi:MAG: hypothetical protein Q7T93_16455 [Methylobacterium sp.]|uniref:hypothetical protein n=1 Tax=Methylobacterium sp. TaxID=409 RepID=UPI00271C0E3C|nr:hypothetical protein [Methylobacterium sp.]MDO9428409.1 hypothetical protein [Methylobacterium sp.]
MGDERPATAEHVAATVPVAEAAGRDQDSVRPSPDEAAGEAEVEGGDDREAKTAIRSDEGRARLSIGTTAATAPEDRTAGYTKEAAAAEFEHVEETGRVTTLDEIEGHVLRAIRYHEARARFLDFWRRVFDFLVVVLGAGAVTTAFNKDGLAITLIGVALAAIGALQLVAGFSEKAGEHTSLKRRFCGILAMIMEARGEGAVNPRQTMKITKRWAAIWADEPPTLHVLEAIAHNAARRSREFDLDEDSLIEIGPWQSLTRNLSSWEGFEPLTRAERAARKAAKSV